MQPHITFIGVGNMATAIIRGLIQSGYPTGKITGTARNQEKRATYQKKYKIQMLEDNSAAILNADIIVLCVKPTQMQDVIAAFREKISADQLFVSVAAGIDLASFEAWLGKVAIVRSMPNTPSQVGAGMTGLIANQHTTEQHRNWVDTLFASVGQSNWVYNEEDMHTITALSGSAPAYFFRFLEAMVNTGRSQGLDEKTCRQLASQAMLGAAKMAIESEEDIVTLRKNITSPNGTTEKALLSFEANNIETTVEHAMTACIQRSKEMTQLFSAKTKG